MIRKTVIATLIGLSAASISQANDKIDALYERLTQQDVFGYALHLAQTGGKHTQAKPLKGFGSAGIRSR